IHVVVAEVLQCLRGKSGPGSACTIDDNRLTLIWQHFVSLDLQKSARQENRLVEVALFPLIAFAYVKKGKAIVWIEFIPHFLNGYFSDLRFCLAENLFKVAHWYPYSIELVRFNIRELGRAVDYHRESPSFLSLSSVACICSWRSRRCASEAPG